MTHVSADRWGGPGCSARRPAAALRHAAGSSSLHAGVHMRVYQQEIRDFGPLNAEGIPAYAYVYTVYRFVSGGRVLLARCYLDQPDSASLLGWRVGKEDRDLLESDLGDPLMLQAVAHLRGLGRVEIRWFDRAGACYRELVVPTPHRG